MQLRLEEAFGLILALILGSALYALYHIGYGMTGSEMVFHFFVSIAMFAIVWFANRYYKKHQGIPTATKAQIVESH